MKQNLLLKTQKNEALELIKKWEFDPFNFTWKIELSKITKNLEVSKLLYNNTEFYFIFDYNIESQTAVYAPGYERWETIDYNGAWDIQLYSFEKWLENLKREIDAPDLWREVQKYQLPKDTRIDPNIKNEPFTAYQVNTIEIGLDRIRNYLTDNISEDIKTKDNLEVIDKKIDYLKGALYRQGRLDWFHTCIGVLITIAIELALSPEKAKIIWDILKNTLSGIIKFLPLL